MTGLRKGLLLGGLHLALVLSLGAKLLIDRATRPRVWVKTAPVDPSLPIRGRYVSLRAEVPVTGVARLPIRPRPAYLKETDPWPPTWESHDLQVDLSVSASGLTARRVPEAAPQNSYRLGNAFMRTSVQSLPEDQWTVTLREPMAYFIPEHVPDPSLRKEGEELWVEVTLPKKGPLRPIRLGVKKQGVITPLAF